MFSNEYNNRQLTTDSYKTKGGEGEKINQLFKWYMKLIKKLKKEQRKNNGGKK